MKKIFPAQIMVIVLVLMSILSVIALSVTLTSVRDQTEKTQNSQYQTYYAVGENKLLDFQQQIGRISLATAIPAAGSMTLSGDTGNPLSGTCATNVTPPNSKTCTFGGIDSTNFNTDKAEVLKTIITTTDSSEITNFTAEKDKDILLDIEASTLPIQIQLSWTGTTTAWSFTVDKTDYTSEKAVFSPDATIFSKVITSYPILPETSTCFNYTSSGSSVTINILASCSNKMFIRLRPLLKSGDSTLINNLKVVGNTLPLQRTISSTTTTESNVVSGQDSPTVVLESTYLLTTQPLGLFDYVLRTESDVIKQ